MDVKLLELHFAQLSKSWSKSKFNNYSDKKKQAYKNELASLFSKLQAEDFARLSATQILERYYIIDFFFKSLEFLDSSTLNLIPFEIVECLRLALNDWLDASEDFIIVTSLVNDPTGFSFDPTLVINNYLYTLIRNVYQIEFQRRLIQINLPRFLVRDYLANVVLYHELGHFVDLKYSISDSLALDIIRSYAKPNLLTPEERGGILEYFPDIEDVLRQHQDPQIISYHAGEYFCDIFASQYIESCSNNYLSYLTQGSPGRSFSHPSTNSRIKLVELFLSGDSQCFVLNKLKQATKSITSKEIAIRFKEIDQNSFVELLPTEIQDQDSIHFLFVLGWRTWLNDWNIITVNNNIQFQIEPNQVYSIINNLIEKSINNYIVTKQWELSHAITKGATAHSN